MKPDARASFWSGMVISRSDFHLTDDCSLTGRVRERVNGRDKKIILIGNEGKQGARRSIEDR